MNNILVNFSTSHLHCPPDVDLELGHDLVDKLLIGESARADGGDDLGHSGLDRGLEFGNELSDLRGEIF